MNNGGGQNDHNMKALQLILLFFILNGNLGQSQDNPVWDIGTKWTYELLFPSGAEAVSFVTNEIVDTVFIDDLKLYKVSSSPVYTGISYFHFSDSKVYNYNPNSKILQLLYDFDNTTSYETEYRPICDPDFPYDSLNSQSYIIEVDSVVQYELPNGLTTTMQYTSNEVTRRVLRNVGFMEGYLHYTHDWELGTYICDEFANAVNKLRCFENDSVSYNFVSYPCDSIWLTTSTHEIDYTDIEIMPNPTRDKVLIKGIDNNIDYELYNMSGGLVKKGETVNKTVELGEAGIFFLRLKVDNRWRVEKVVKLD